jgi:hypothetical protein
VKLPPVVEILDEKFGNAHELENNSRLSKDFPLPLMAFLKLLTKYFVALFSPLTVFG